MNERKSRLWELERNERSDCKWEKEREYNLGGMRDLRRGQEREKAVACIDYQILTLMRVIKSKWNIYQKERTDKFMWAELGQSINRTNEKNWTSLINNKIECE